MVRPDPPPASLKPERGIILLALLLMLVLVGIGALAAAEVWSTARKRERETQLLFVGDQYRRAIASYWNASPGLKALPTSVDQLLNDDRFPDPVHHLRRRYRDPVTDDTTDLALLTVGNSLIGVHSTSTDAPLKHAGFPKVDKEFEKARRYSQWKFVFLPPGMNAPIAPAPGSGPAAAGPAAAELRPSQPRSPW